MGTFSLSQNFRLIQLKYKQNDRVKRKFPEQTGDLRSELLHFFLERKLPYHLNTNFPFRWLRVPSLEFFWSTINIANLELKTQLFALMEKIGTESFWNFKPEISFCEMKSAPSDLYSQLACVIHWHAQGAPPTILETQRAGVRSFSAVHRHK